MRSQYTILVYQGQALQLQGLAFKPFGNIDNHPILCYSFRRKEILEMAGKGKSIIRCAIESEAERRGISVEQAREEYLAELRKTETPENIARAEEASKDTDEPEN